MRPLVITKLTCSYDPELDVLRLHGEDLNDRRGEDYEIAIIPHYSYNPQGIYQAMIKRIDEIESPCQAFATDATLSGYNIIQDSFNWLVDELELMAELEMLIATLRFRGMNPISDEVLEAVGEMTNEQLSEEITHCEKQLNAWRASHSTRV